MYRAAVWPGRLLALFIMSLSQRAALSFNSIKRPLIPLRKKKSGTVSLGTRGGFPVRQKLSLKTSGLAESAPKPQLRSHTGILLSNTLYTLYNKHQAMLSYNRERLAFTVSCLINICSRVITQMSAYRFLPLRICQLAHVVGERCLIAHYPSHIIS